MADLKVTIKESINLNNTSYGSTRSATYKDITDVYKRTLTLTADAVINLYTTVASQTEGSVLDKDSIKYVRVSNLESSEAINVKLTQGSDAGVTWIQVAAGDSLILGTHSEAMDAAAEALVTPTLGDITQVDASANTAETTARIEIFVASVINAS
jgi:hypothetical protein